MNCKLERPTGEQRQRLRISVEFKSWLCCFFCLALDCSLRPRIPGWNMLPLWLNFVTDSSQTLFSAYQTKLIQKILFSLLITVSGKANTIWGGMVWIELCSHTTNTLQRYRGKAHGSHAKLVGTVSLVLSLKATPAPISWHLWNAGGRNTLEQPRKVSSGPQVGVCGARCPWLVGSSLQTCQNWLV